jgi:hypothetical protein
MVVEALGSLLVGILSGNFALIAFGSDSFIELLSGYVVLNHLKEEQSGLEIDSKNTEFLTRMLLFSLIPIISIGAVYSYLIGLRPESTPIGIAIAIGAVIIVPYFWYQKKRIGKEARCLPLSIDAVESKTCFLMSLALLGGLLAEFFFGFWWADYLATGIILILITKEAIESYKETKGA